MPANGDEAVTLKQLREFGKTLGGGGSSLNRSRWYSHINPSALCSST